VAREVVGTGFNEAINFPLMKNISKYVKGKLLHCQFTFGDYRF
jgi:hypothetical protein